MTSLQIDNLVKTFGAFVAVDHATLQVERGEIFGFLGPNSASTIGLRPVERAQRAAARPEIHP